MAEFWNVRLFIARIFRITKAFRGLCPVAARGRSDYLGVCVWERIRTPACEKAPCLPVYRQKRLFLLTLALFCA